MSLNRLKDYFIETVLPVWASKAFDADAGQFMEGLQTDGTADPSGVVRTRTAAREIYVFAQASTLGVAPEGALDKAERAFANLRATAWIGGDKPGYARSINYKSGTIIDPERDLYDHACVLLALAWLAEATGKPAYGDQIEELVAAMDITLAAPHGGWAEDSAASVPRRQNPHMHCFESFLALWETDADPANVARAGELYSLFRARFLHDPTDTLREYFGPAWEMSDTYGSSRIDPGHMAEWVWLIGRYAQFCGRDLSGLTGRLLDATLKLGIDAGTPFLVDETGLDGIPAKSSRRLWPQAELIKAYITQARSTGDDSHLHRADALAAALFETYLAETPAGTWRDCFGLDGNPIATSIPASSLYHLWTAVAELVQAD